MGIKCKWMFFKRKTAGKKKINKNLIIKKIAVEKTVFNDGYCRFTSKGEIKGEERDKKSLREVIWIY